MEDLVGTLQRSDLREEERQREDAYRRVCKPGYFGKAQVWKAQSLCDCRTMTPITFG